MTGKCGSPTWTAWCGSAPERWAPTPSSSSGLRSRRDDLLADGALSGSALCRAYSDVADGWLSDLLGTEPNVALVAVGGYGRRELCPGSDLDVVLLHRGVRHVREVAERIWYPVWDAKVGLDHSVRTLKEALAVAEGDLKAVLGLLDARFVAGDPTLAAELSKRVREAWRKRAGRWLGALAPQVRARHSEFDEVAFLLEPELKEGRGGLRDVHAIRAAALATPVVDASSPALADAYEALLGVRVELHRRTGRTLDRLVLQEQDGVAAALGYRSADDLMAAVSAAARTIAWWSDDAWWRVESMLAGPRGRTSAKDRILGPGLLLREGQVVLAPDAVPSEDPALILRAAAVAAEQGAPLAHTTLDRLARQAIGPAGRDSSEPWPAAARHALIALLGTGHAAIPVLEALDQRDLLVRVLPEWEAVRWRPQRNAYHRFTVDRHLCEAAAHAAVLTRQVSRPDLLLVGAWLHDIGKGFPGDHTEVGMEVVEVIAKRMGFEPEDVATLVSMVQHHLLLPDVATRRDVHDPLTVDAVAEAVGDRDTLDLLAALTQADGLATGHAAWSPWKAGLVEDLVRRVAGALAGHRPPQVPSLPTPEQAQLMARGGLEVIVDGDEVTVIAPDRPGLFSRVSGTLALQGLDVRSAVAASDDSGMAVEVFEVDAPFGARPDPERLRAGLERALSGRLSLEARLAERARAYASGRRATAARAAEPRVLFDNEASASATVVEVRAPDGIGVLYRITRALADSDLDVRTAKVSTLGHEVVDAFYVVDATGNKVTDSEHLMEIERSLLAELTRL